MPSTASNTACETVVVLGTGGTIAGVAARADDHVGYKAGQLGAQALVAAVPPLAARADLVVEAETLAQLDSCDMDHGTWLALLERARAVLARPEVTGLVVTHGTDTLEETAYFLHRTLAPRKPVVFTAAMRPATALSADGPQNLLDAVTLAATAGARGVLVAFAGKVYAGADLRKVHGYRVEAFDAGDAGVLGIMADGQLQRYRPWPEEGSHAAAAALPPAAAWPVVDVVMSHAGVRGEVIDTLVAAGARGLVVAGTGNGSVHRALVEAARRAEAAGVVVRRASRCQLGGVVGSRADSLPSAGVRTAPQARIELMLDLIAAAR
jgi:L-asparaginase